MNAIHPINRNEQDLTNPTAESEFDFIEYFKCVYRWRYYLIPLVAATCILTAIVSLVATETYRAEVTVIPLQAGASSSNLSSLLAASAAAIPMLGGAFMQSGSEHIQAVLYSRSLAETVINELGLMKILLPQLWDAKSQKWTQKEELVLEQTIDMLQQQVVQIVEDPKLTTVTVGVETTDPELSAKIANSYIQHLVEMLDQKGFSLAAKNRQFVETQKSRTHDELMEAETSFLTFQKQTNLLEVDAQTELSLRYISDIEATLMQKRIRLDLLRQNTGPSNPELIGLRKEIEATERELSGLSTTTGKPADTKNPKNDHSMRAIKSISELTGLAQQYVQLKRNVLTLEKVYDLLTQQYEMARITEKQSQDAVEVLDAAKVPQKRFKPKRTRNVLLAILGSSTFGILSAFCLDGLRRRGYLQSIPENPWRRVAT